MFACCQHCLDLQNDCCLPRSISCRDVHVMMQDQASSKVDAALREAGSEPQQLAQLLTGQRMAAAVSLASASGDIRLAMLLCQVGSCVSLCKQCCHVRLTCCA